MGRDGNSSVYMTCARCSGMHLKYGVVMVDQEVLPFFSVDSELRHIVRFLESTTEI